MSRILFIIRDNRYFYTHRLALAMMLKNEGHAVRVLCSCVDLDIWNQLEGLGFQMRDVPFMEAAGNPLKMVESVWKILHQFKEFSPQSVFSVTALATMLGGMCARLFQTRHIALIAGLGSLFHTETVKMRTLRPLATMLFKAALKRSKTKVIFQNISDCQTFIRAHICRDSQATVIQGSGVNLGLFEYQPYQWRPTGIRRVGLVARMLRDKGVVEFLQAAEAILSRRQDVEFILVGGVDEGNPTSFQREDLERLTNRPGMKWLGHREDIAAVLKTLDVFCLPSYHEGLPKAMLEAASVGCALIVSNIPGCTAFVEHGVNGLTIPKKNAQALSEAILYLLDRPDKAQEFSREARKRVEKSFADNVILHSYRQLFVT